MPYHSEVVFKFLHKVIIIYEILFILLKLSSVVNMYTLLLFKDLK